jgi:hypothetical protein
MTKETIFFFLCAFALKVSAQQNSYIQVKAEPNISVFLNDEFKGKTNVEIGGLIIENLKAGNYNIKVVKDGYMPQTEVVSLKTGEVKIFQVKPFAPQYKISQSGNKQEQTIELKTGSLKIQSLPVEIQIEITDLGIKSSKTQDEWNIEDIPIGLHKVRFTWTNKILIDTVRVEQGTLKHIFVNLIDGKIENRSNSMLNINSSEISISFDSGKEQYFHVKNGNQVILCYVLNDKGGPNMKFIMPDYKDFIFIYGLQPSYSSQTSVVGGKMISKYNYTYVVCIEAQTAGTFVLPEVSIEYFSEYLNETYKYKSDKTILVVE